ncbi:metallo-beta-lactamase domain-containing protein 1 [Callorhinchus milii]|uniref:metallo-beta-lactamase domain-containing protein 1 n=1 Tax=Callorhinchus milii TaxID=7868 RepID=UPI00045758F0|nr:metallo-beta-lactamase domain-containing protein 1 [Callorhinchus milii]|eukprot:gi/632992404/ref/XP_007885077.1/ PREDICTED: metallo-beta-lactamase domain-containing protein 1 [Callorhinchus milii]
MSAPWRVRTEPRGSHEIRGGPYSVHVIQEGYAYTDPEGRVRADGTVTLVKGPRVIVVDTGSPGDGPLIVEGLRQRGVAPGDVTHVVCTHGHSDHVGNLGLFPQATFVVSHDVCRGHVYSSHGLSEGQGLPIDGWAEVLPTPGHCARDVSLLVRGTAEGQVVVAGDLFEREADEGSWQAVSENPALQAQHRRRVLELADVVVPGHGPPFRVIKGP